MNKLPSIAAMYNAVLSRDTSFEGVFYVAVRTTGIFCRPTCPARKPKADNVEFFATTNDALYAGYRPCSRCNPLEKEKTAPELVKRLCAAVEESPTRKITDSQLRAMDIEPSTARRQFQRYYGMTFHAYHRARRMGLAMHEIRNGETVIGAQINNGFESASGFWEAFKNVFGIPPKSAEKANCLFAKWIETPLGSMMALAGDEGLYMLEFVDRRALENEISELRKQTDSVIVPGQNAHLEKISQELKDYFDGKLTEFTVPLIIGGSPFENAVWNHLREIPIGEAWSYLQLAKRLNNRNATRAVGRANGRNRLAIVIPCHRVIQANGKLCGYGGGVWRKQWLLDHEKKMTGQRLALSL